MIAAHLSGITNVKKFSIVIINLIHNLGQYNLVQLIVMYAFMRNWSFQICLHMHPKSFDAGLRKQCENDKKYQLIVAQGHHMSTKIWVDICSDNGLLLEGTKPLPQP